MEAAQRSIALKPQSAAPASVGLDGDAAVSQNLKVAVEGADTDTKFGRQFRGRYVLTRLEEPLEFLQPAHP